MRARQKTAKQSAAVHHTSSSDDGSQGTCRYSRYAVFESEGDEHGHREKHAQHLARGAMRRNRYPDGCGKRPGVRRKIAVTNRQAGLSGVAMTCWDRSEQVSNDSAGGTVSCAQLQTSQLQRMPLTKAETKGKDTCGGKQAGNIRTRQLRSHAGSVLCTTGRYNISSSRDEHAPWRLR